MNPKTKKEIELYLDEATEKTAKQNGRWGSMQPSKRASKISYQEAMNGRDHLNDILDTTTLGAEKSDTATVFSLNRVTIEHLLNQAGCEGLQIILRAEKVNGKESLKATVIPVNGYVQPLSDTTAASDTMRTATTDADIYVVNTLTECPPKICN